MLADEVDYVVGVDTHRDEHTLAVVVAATGVVVGQRSTRASGRGYAEALRFAEQQAGARVWAVEGAGHYGAGLARYLSGRGETVLEIGRGPRDERRLQGKNDSHDAIRAARTALASKTLALPRSGQRREALRLLLLARRSAVDVRRLALVQLRSVIVTAPDPLREGATRTACPAADRPLQPPSLHELSSTRRTRHQASAPQPRPPHRSGNRRGRRARTRDPRPRPRARSAAARRARRRPIPRPPPLPSTRQPGTANDLTGHRSIDLNVS
jgi:hypothetical protein